MSGELLDVGDDEPDEVPWASPEAVGEVTTAIEDSHHDAVSE
jgi:hypothetical protein